MWCLSQSTKKWREEQENRKTLDIPDQEHELWPSQGTWEKIFLLNVNDAHKRDTDLGLSLINKWADQKLN